GSRRSGCIDPLPCPECARAGPGAMQEAIPMLQPIEALPRIAEAPASALQDVLAMQQPCVIRGLAADWPLVQAARRSDADAVSYLRRFANPALPAVATIAPPQAGGRIFYDAS